MRPLKKIFEQVYFFYCHLFSILSAYSPPSKIFEKKMLAGGGLQADVYGKYSFDECKNYFSLKIKEKCKDNVKVILLGNKSDLENDRVVSYEEAKNFADLNNYIFTEISCLKNENIFELFQELIGLTVIKNKNINSKIKQNDIKNENEKNNLCYII